MMYQNSHPAHMSSLGKQTRRRVGGDCEPMETRSMTRSLLASSMWPAWRCCRTAFLRHSANRVVFMSKMPKIPKMRWKSFQKLLWFAFSISSHLKKTTTPSTKSYPLPLSLPSSTPKFRFALLESPLDSSFPSPPPRPRPRSLHHVLILFQVVCTLGTTST